jgi:hypothetical protein
MTAAPVRCSNRISDLSGKQSFRRDPGPFTLTARIVKALFVTNNVYCIQTR